MSTIHHPAQIQLWWYAAAIGLAGAALALMVLILQSSGSGASTSHNGTTTTTYAHRHYPAYGCHARHPVANNELAPCITPVR